MTYLDNAATTFPKPENVYIALDNANRNLAVNAGRGSYKIAREATRLIDATKNTLLKMVDAPSASYIAFSASITLALNEILQGVDWKEDANIYVSPYEHNAVARTVNYIAKKMKVNVIELPLKKDTLEIDLENTKYLFSKNIPTCLCCTHISNVTGYILPVEDIFKLAKRHGAITILDTAQSLGLIEVNIQKIQADFIAFAGHKALYGPFGIGGFISTGRIHLEEVILGGTGSDSLNLEMPKKTPEKYESSSPNIIAIAGLYAALKECECERDAIYKHEKMLTSYLVEKLSLNKNITLYVPPSDTHVSVVSFNLDGYKADDLGMILDEDFNIAVRAGYHCAPYIHKWLKNEEYVGTVRVGLGRFNTVEDIYLLIDAIDELA